MLLRSSNYLDKIGHFNIVNNIPRLFSNIFLIATLKNSYNRLQSSSTNPKRMSSTKPPNIFVYTGENIESPSCFQSLKKTLQSLLNRDKYVIYHLQPSKLLSIPWQNNTVALIVRCQQMADPVRHTIQNYLSTGGKVLTMCSGVSFPGVVLTKELDPKYVSISYGSWPPFKAMRGSFLISSIEETCETLATETESLQPLIVKGSFEGGMLVVSQVCLSVEPSVEEEEEEEKWARKCLGDLLAQHLRLECSHISDGRSAPEPLPTPAHLFIKPGVQSLMSDLKSRMNKNTLRLTHMKMEIAESPPTSTVVTNPEGCYPVTLNFQGINVPGFDGQLFHQQLTTRLLGSALFYADTVTSTMDFLEGLPVDIGAVAVANVQTTGKGRAGNAWLSPRGCAMFSVQVCVERDTNLGGSLPFLQQLATLAVLLAVKGSTPGSYQNLDIGVKWPNDLYYARKVKFGGVLAKSTMMGNTFHCYLGIGVNLNNGLPTVCVNDLIKAQDQINGTQTELLRLEVLLARTLNNLERLVDDCQRKGIDYVLPQLYPHWIHQLSQLSHSHHNLYQYTC